MATQLKLDPETEAIIDDLMASGRFADRHELLCHGVRLVYDEAPVDAETIALLEQRIAEADADPSGGIPAEKVFAEMERRCLEELAFRRNAAA